MKKNTAFLILSVFSFQKTQRAIETEPAKLCNIKIEILSTISYKFN